MFTQRKILLESGKWDEDLCPLCGADIPQDELLSHIQEHQKINKEIQEEITTFEHTREKARAELQQISNLVGKINVYFLSVNRRFSRFR